MAGHLKVNAVQLGDDPTPTKNLVIRTNQDGTFTVARGNVGETTQDILTIDANGRVAVRGTVLGDDAPAGFVGEYLSASRLFVNSVALTTATGVVVTSLSLTAGDWDVRGKVGLISANTTAVSRVIALTSTGNTYQADLPGVASYMWIPAATINTGGNGNPIVESGVVRFNLTETTTVNLVAYANFSGGAASAFGEMSARRVR